MGMDPMEFLSREKEDYLIASAIVTNALKISSERKTEEVKVLAELVGFEVAKTVAQIFG